LEYTFGYKDKHPPAEGVMLQNGQDDKIDKISERSYDSEPKNPPHKKGHERYRTAVVVDVGNPLGE